jgi:hypothetical protein
MAWPATAVVTDDPVTASQLNGLPVRLANTTLSGDTASISFSSIPAHYAHLMLVCYARGTVAATGTSLVMRFNADAGANYDRQYVYGLAATAQANEAFAATSMDPFDIPGASAGANLFAGVKILIPHYAGAANNKVVSSRYARKTGTASGNLEIVKTACFWRSSAAINEITLVPLSGNILAGSRFTLYGLPG